LRQAVGVTGRETGNIDTKSDALGGIASLGRIRRLRDLGLRCAQAASQGIRVWFQRKPDWRLDQSAVCLGQAQILCMPRVNQCLNQNGTEHAQPGQQDSQRLVVVRVPRRPCAGHSAAAFHDESEVVAIGFDVVLGIHGMAMVINQMHESHTATSGPSSDLGPTRTHHHPRCDPGPCLWSLCSSYPVPQLRSRRVHPSSVPHD
jgi:hypothetical protein